MSKILTHNKNADAEYVDGKSNEILSITEAQHYAVNWVDHQGKRQTVLCMVFGKMEDEGPGVFILANPEEVRKQLKLPDTKFLKQFRAQLAARGPVEAADLPPTPGMGGAEAR